MNKFLFLIALLTLALSSCVNEPEGPNEGPKKDLGSLKFRITVSNGLQAAGGLQTKAETMGGYIADESKINKLTFLFFEMTPDGSGVFEGYHQVTEDDFTEVVNDATTGTKSFQIEMKFDDKSGLSKSGTYNFLAIANIVGTYFQTETELQAFLDNLKENGKTETELKNSMVKYVAGQATVDYTKPLVKKDNLPMTGSGSKAKEEEEVALKLVRTMSRFDVQCVATGYTLASADIYNVFSYPPVFEDVVPNYEQGRTAYFYGLKHTPNPGITDDNAIAGGLYVPVNNVESPSQNDKKTTCLVVGLKEDASGNTYYYRVNFNAKGVGQYLKRNNIYKLQITKVNSTSHSTAADAYTNSAASDLVYSINTWDRDEDGLILTDGDNMLALPTVKASFTAIEEVREYNIFTSGVGTLEMYRYIASSRVYEKVDNGVEVDLLEGEANFKVKRQGNKLIISVKDYANNVREAQLRFKFAGMSGDMIISQDGLAKKSLHLSHMNIPTYPSGVSGDKSFYDVVNDPIIVNSSGTSDAWTATILLSSGFSFSQTEEDLVATGHDGDIIPAIYSLKANSSEKTLTNFILVSLDEDDANHRNVVVMKQNGSTEFSIIPNSQSVSFEADGKLYPNQSNEFTVRSSSEDQWHIDVKNNAYDSDNKKKFKLEYYNEVEEKFVPVTLPWRPTGSTFLFRVNPVGENFFGEHQAELLIQQNLNETTGEAANTKSIGLIQEDYKLTIEAQEFASWKGENVEVKVVLEGSTKTMSATLDQSITLDGITLDDPIYGGEYKATFADGTSQMTNVQVSNFTVVVPPIQPPYGYFVTGNSTVTIKIKIDDTGIEKTLVITQGKPILKGFGVQNSQASSSSFNSTGYFNFWRVVMGNTNWYGPNGTVRMPETKFNWLYSHQALQEDVRVVNIVYQWMNAAATNSWKKKDNIVFLLTTWDNPGSVTNYLPAGYSLQNWDVSATLPRVISSAPTTSKATKLWKYLVGGEGPFGLVDESKLKIMSYDSNCAVMSKYPSTFIPIIMNPETNTDRKGALFGIDPTNRFVVIADCELFHNPAYRGGKNFNSNDDGTGTTAAGAQAENLRFLQNVVAYVVNVSLYGDAFNNQFKVK